MDGNGAVRTKEEGTKYEICLTACRYIGYKRKELCLLQRKMGRNSLRL